MEIKILKNDPIVSLDLIGNPRDNGSLCLVYNKRNGSYYHSSICWCCMSDCHHFKALCFDDWSNNYYSFQKAKEEFLNYLDEFILKIRDEYKNFKNDLPIKFIEFKEAVKQLEN